MQWPAGRDIHQFTSSYLAKEFTHKSQAKKRQSSFISEGKIKDFYFEYFLKCLVQVAFCDNEQSKSAILGLANL